METFKDKVVVVTGAAQGIGRCIADEFLKAGSHVCVIDKQEGQHFVGDISDKQVLERFAQEVIGKYGHVDYLINNALPLMKGINECSYEEFQYAMSVGITAPFYLAKLFTPYFAEGAAIVNISSSRDRMSQPQTESYTLRGECSLKGKRAICSEILKNVYKRNAQRMISLSICSLDVVSSTYIFPLPTVWLSARRCFSRDRCSEAWIRGYSP